jgi:hypothetical protein
MLLCAVLVLGAAVLTAAGYHTYVSKLGVAVPNLWIRLGTKCAAAAGCNVLGWQQRVLLFIKLPAICW